MFDLKKEAVSALPKEESADVLKALLASEGIEMVQAAHPPTAASAPPTGTGAVDPNPMKRG